MSQWSISSVPTIRHSRSRFDLSHGVKTSGNVGTLYPFDVQEVIPGDTFKVRTAAVSRLAAQFLRPVMDNLFLDVMYFFVPSRLLYDKFVNVMGENTESAYANTVEYEVPVFSGTIPSKSVGDYLGLPVGVPLEESVLPFRAFAKVYNEWFRDQNNISPIHVIQGEAAESETPNNRPWGPNNYFGTPPKVSKFHDYFTSCLPSSQKGVAPPLGLTGVAPVSIGGVNNLPVNTSLLTHTLDAPMKWQSIGGGSLPSSVSLYPVVRQSGASTSGQNYSAQTVDVTSMGINNFVVNVPSLTGTADLSQATPFTVNDLRFAFQYQKMLERDSYAGTRYVEMLAAHYGVQAGDYRLQRSEYLGGRRSPLSIHQVVQTTGSGSDSSPLGEVGAFSLSNSGSRYTKGFTEFGYVIGVWCIRQHHTYQQGVPRFWSRKKRTDFYNPLFSTLGEQPVYKKELYASGTSDDEKPFGYLPAWEDLRMRQNHVTGQMRTGVENSLDVWHFADYYGGVPTLSQGFIEETPDYVDRSISVESSTMDQFIIDFWIQNIAYRPLPTYSVPGLIDHH